MSTKRVAESIDMNVWIPAADTECAVELSTAILRIFRDEGGRKDRQTARLMWLVESYGEVTEVNGHKRCHPDYRAAVVNEMASYGRGLEKLVDEQQPVPSTPFERSKFSPATNYLGVHAQPQEGLSRVGIHVPVGRLSVEEARKIADLAERYCPNGEIRLTVEQNVILPNVKNEDVDALLAEPSLHGDSRLRVHPGNIVGNLVSCTGAQFCGLAIIETKSNAENIAAEVWPAFGSRTHPALRQAPDPALLLARSLPLSLSSHTHLLLPVAPCRCSSVSTLRVTCASIGPAAPTRAARYVCTPLVSHPPIVVQAVASCLLRYIQELSCAGISLSPRCSYWQVQAADIGLMGGPAKKKNEKGQMKVGSAARKHADAAHSSRFRSPEICRLVAHGRRWLASRCLLVARLASTASCSWIRTQSKQTTHRRCPSPNECLYAGLETGTEIETVFVCGAPPMRAGASRLKISPRISSKRS
jgi:hypothetical protein